MQKTKILFNIINTITIILYVYPGSILGFLIYGEFHKQPQITQDFLSISSNHVYTFFLLSSVGLIAYYKKDLKKITYYLFLVSIFLELMHIIVPNRGFEVADLLGNILGVILSLILYKLFNFRRLK